MEECTLPPRAVPKAVEIAKTASTRKRISHKNVIEP